MPIKRAPNTLSTEDLLKELEEANKLPDEPEVIGYSYKNDVVTFLSVFDIKPGGDFIKKNTLHSIYKVWSKDAISKKDFFKELSQFLEMTNQSYKINQNAIKLTHDTFVKFKKERAKLTSKAWGRHFEGFLEYHALKAGNFWIEGEIFFFLYDKYMYTTRPELDTRKYMSKKEFYKFCDLYLPKKITKFGKVYGLTENIQNFFQNGQLARMKERHEKEEQEKIEKRQSNLSRFRSKVQSKDKS